MSKKTHLGKHGKYGFIYCGAEYFANFTKDPKRATCQQCLKNWEQQKPRGAENPKG